MTKQIRGVNVGAWLILEKWLTPTLFTGSSAVDEYTFMRDPDAKNKIERHRRTFITKSDFKWMSEHSINLVRIPVGYWLFDTVDGYVPSVQYLDKAMKWAEEYGLRILIDLHGAKGSQNGFDSSGKVGKPEWFDTPESQRDTIDILCKIAKRYNDSSALWGIELLNEPMSKGHYFGLLRFYRDAYEKVSDILRPDVYIVFHDSFRPLLLTGALRRRRTHPVMMDIHWYGFAFTGTNLQTYLWLSAISRKILVRFLQLWQPVLIGEWSTVLPQRFFDAKPVDEHFNVLGQNAAMQIDSYRHAAGWIYWNYKAQGDGMWNYRWLVENDVITVKDM